MQTDHAGNRLSRYEWIYLSTLFSAVLSCLIVFTGYHDDLNADSIIPYLVSLQKWTPFFWGQDRYGMIIPWLTSWLHDPLANMLLQNALHITTSFMSFFLLARYLFSPRSTALIGSCSIMIYLLGSGTGDIKNFLSPWQIYGPALFFGLLSLLLVSRRPLVALALMMLAHWCNFSVGVLLAPLILIKSIVDFPEKGGSKTVKTLLPPALVLLLSAGFGVWLKNPYVTGQIKGYAFSEPLDWSIGWIYLVKSYLESPRSSLWLLVIPVCLFLVSWILRRQPLDLRPLAIGFGSSVIYAVIVGATIFAKWNGYHHRYLIPSLIVLVVTLVGLAVAQSRFSPARWTAVILAITSLGVVMRFGSPGIATVHAALDHRLSQPYLEARKASCTHLAGNYYRVWDTVFYSLVQGEQPFWGITFRSATTREQWDLKHFTNPRVCLWKDQLNEGYEQLRSFQLFALKKGDETDTIIVLVPQVPFELACRETGCD